MVNWKMSFLQLYKVLQGPKTGISLYLLTNRKLHTLWYYFGRQVSNRAGYFAKMGREARSEGWEVGVRGQEVGIEGAGSGDPVPPVDPHTAGLPVQQTCWQFFPSLSLSDYG